MNQFLLYCFSIISDEVQQSKFETIYYAHRQAMFYTAHRILRDQHLAEDAVQEAFLRIIKNLHKIDADDCHKTKGFLVIIVKNIAIDMYNKRKKQSEVLLDETIKDTASAAFSAEDDSIAQIARCIKKLPDLYAHSMTLYYLYELNDKECAQLLNISVATVRKRLERGRALLKEQLEREVAEYAEL